MSAETPLADLDAHPGVAKPDPVLIVDDMLRRFGGLRAVDVEHMEIQRGAITALIGPNGAGKTTLFNLVTGFDRPDAGRWTFDGTQLQGRPAHQIARLGMVRTFQLTKALNRMTVLDNMRLAARHQRGEGILASLVKPLWSGREAEIDERARQLLAHVGLTDLADEFAGTLSGGQRKLLELVRALMVEPSLVMLDEPMAGVNPALVESLLDHITELRDTGRTVVFVEHDMDVVQTISDWVIVLAGGKVISEGLPAHVAADPVVIEAYLGHTREARS